jgi:nucleotide-binding universal stress UspA family protein
LKVNRKELTMRYILAGFNGSECSAQAVLHARDMANQAGARLHVLTVVTVPAFGFDVYMDDLMEERVTRCEQLMEALKARLGECPTAHLVLRVGDPALELVHHATEYGVGRIVVGCRNRYFGRWPASRIVRHVLAQAPCPVTIIGKPEADRPRSGQEFIALESGI